MLKSICRYLIQKSTVDSELKLKLRKLLPYFNEVSLLELNNNIFKDITVSKQTTKYKVAFSICEMIYNNILLEQEIGEVDFYSFMNKNLPTIFELFLYEFYKKEQSKYYTVKHSKRIEFNFDDINDLVPTMELDILLEDDDESIIIDAKYYKDATTEYFEKDRLRSSHFYQMLSYINNYKTTNRVRSILIYPLTDREINETYNGKRLDGINVSDTSISFNTVNLFESPDKIKDELIKIILHR